MYCSSCGAAVKPELSYCNRCGAELKAKQDDSTSVTGLTPDSLVWAIVSVTIVGLGAVIGMMAVMKEVLHFNEGLIIAFASLSFLTFLAVDAVFIWLLLRSRMGAKESGSTTQGNRFTRRELSEASGRALAESALSVTEHTTRTLEPAGSELKRE